MSQPETVTPPRKISTFWKFVLWTAGLLVLLLLGVSAGINLYLSPLITKKLEQVVQDASGGLYKLHMDKLSVRFWQGEVSAGGVVVALDSTYYDWMVKNGRDVGHSRFLFKSPVITLSHIRWRQYLSEEVVRVGEVFVDYPELQLHRDVTLPRRSKPTAERTSPADSLEAAVFDRLPQVIREVTKALVIDTLAINQAKIRYELINQTGTSYHAADSITIAFRGIRIDSNSRAESWRRILYAEDLQFGLRNYSFRAADGIYGLTIKRVRAPDPYSLFVDSLDLRTLITDAEFVRRKKYSRDRYAIFIPQLYCRELNIDRFFRKEYIADVINLQQPTLNIYRDKRPPRDPKRRHMPNELVQELPFYFKIDTLEIKDAKIIYAEQVEGATQPGAVVLEQTHAKLLNLTNSPELMSDKTPAVVLFSTQLMGRGLLEVTLAINLLNEQFDCKYNGTLQQMKAYHFNRMFTPNENMRIEDGEVEKVVFAVTVRNGYATGHLKALYHDLKLSVLRQEDKKKRKLLSFLGNLIIRNKNQHTDKKPPKIGEISYQRLYDDGFVRFLWRALKTGLITTLTPDALANSNLIQKGANDKPKE